jgi:hypothetical protein
MSSSRREFVGNVAGAAMFGALPLASLSEAASVLSSSRTPSAEEWDFKWVEALKGKKHKAVFDCTEVESGFGVWRASIWENQYQSVLAAKPGDIRTVLVLRHNAVVMALTQAFWDTYAVGKETNTTHPITMQSTTKNPALLTSMDPQVPAQFDAFALPKFQSRGGIVLACDLALQFFSGGLAKSASIAPEEALKRVRAAVLPGVTVMPSGVFAAVRAQQEGCVYLKAS